MHAFCLPIQLNDHLITDFGISVSPHKHWPYTLTNSVQCGWEDAYTGTTWPKKADLTSHVRSCSCVHMHTYAVGEHISMHTLHIQLWTIATNINRDIRVIYIYALCICTACHASICTYTWPQATLVISSRSKSLYTWPHAQQDSSSNVCTTMLARTQARRSTNVLNSKTPTW